MQCARVVLDRRSVLGSRIALLCLVLAGGLGWTAQGLAQSEPPRRDHIRLPRQYGATVASTIIFAQASYIAAVGDFLESSAIARRHNAIAAEHEMRNSLLWVSTYFDRRELNRAYRLRENPPYLDQEEHRQRQTRRRIEKNTQTVLAGDPTDEMNFMLRELAGVSAAYQLLPGANPVNDSPLDQKLEKGDAFHLRITDGGRRDGQLLIFRADSADVRQIHWPPALRGEQFDEHRQRFEDARDEAVQQIQRDGKLGRDNEQNLMAAMDQLCAAFSEAYPPGLKTAPTRDIMLYLAVKRFLQSLAGSVFRLIETNDARTFDGSYRFEGDSVGDLIQHMCRFGLHFASPEPGDEGTYQKVFFAMRTIHASLAVDTGSSPEKP